MKSGRIFIALLMFVVVALTAVLGGCSDGKEDGADNSPSTGDGQTAGGDADREPTYGGEITVGIFHDLDSSLDPHTMAAAGTAGTREVLFNLFEGLVKPATDGNLIPAVASSYTIDGATYTFTLREGVTFHNGSAVTTEDVVYSIKRCADASSESTYVPAFSVVKNVAATDDSTVVIEIAEPDLEFLAQLTVAIIPADYDGQSTAPVGTGPFRFVSYSPQESLVMEKFEDYWGARAYLDRVTFRISGSADTITMALNSGAIDLCAQLDVDVLDEISEDFYIEDGLMNLVQALYLNNAAAPFDNVLVRQAMSYAVDIGEIMEVLSNGAGQAVGSSMFPAFGKYYVEELAEYYPYNPDKARALLDEAGYGDGFSMTITVPSNYNQHVTTAEILVEQLAEVGITARIELVEWATWVSDVYTDRAYEATVVGVDATYLTARSMLERFESENGKNFINFSNEHFDKVLSAARTATDEAEQVRLYGELQTILAEDSAAVYLQDLPNFVAINGKLAGYKFYPLYVMDLSSVYYVA